MDRGERFRLFVQELGKVDSAGTYDEARDQLETILNRIEDRYSDAPFQPDNWNTDGRMYPPGDDFELKSPFTNVRVFRTRGHYVLIASNGAIKIISAGGGLADSAAKVILSKPGRDGCCCPG